MRSGTIRDIARHFPLWSARALGLGTVLLAVPLPLGGPAPVWTQLEPVRLHAAGSLRGALTNASQAARELPSLQVVQLPAPLAVDAGARAERALCLMSFILSPEGQAILARHGFSAPTTPAG
jgi:hypothetical protein